MCFNKEMSGSFALAGFLMSIWVHYKTKNLQLAMGVFYFFLMEFLQYFQYLVIDDCDNKWNQWLTVVGFAHICLQPYFTHVLNSALTKSPEKLRMYVPILRMCLLGGGMLFMRWIVSDFEGWRTPQEIGEANDSGHNFGIGTEWLRGEKLCTFSGKVHLAWSVPMSDVTYYQPSAAIHSFLMFAPFFVMSSNMVIQGFFLWLTGPFLAAYISPNLFEQASIWCFFSISQIGIMLWLIRDVLLLGWGRKSGKDKNSLSVAHGEAPHLDLRFLWPMGVIVPERKKGN